MQLAWQQQASACRDHHNVYGIAANRTDLCPSIHTGHNCIIGNYVLHNINQLNYTYFNLIIITIITKYLHKIQYIKCNNEIQCEYLNNILHAEDAWLRWGCNKHAGRATIHWWIQAKVLDHFSRPCSKCPLINRTNVESLKICSCYQRITQHWWGMGRDEWTGKASSLPRQVFIF
jgi:hypothetical protein